MTRDEAIEIVQAAEQRAREKAAVRWCPQAPTPKQSVFLGLTCLEALFGGMAGPGKSSGLLMASMGYIDASGKFISLVDVPGYSALILRRTYRDLALPGAIMDRAAEWLRPTAAKWKPEDHIWLFPSGARLVFGYLESELDKLRYQSAEFHTICIDEATQFSETQYLYLFSRLRRLTGSDVPIRMRSASNPGGIGHRFIKARFIDEKTRVGTFIPATRSDNPHLDAEEYEKALDRLDSQTKRQLKDGVWIEDKQTLVYKFDRSRNIVSDLPELADDSWSFIWSCDFGASEKKPTTAVAILAYAASTPTVFLVESDNMAGATVTDIAERYKRDSERFEGFEHVLGDQGGLGGGYIKELNTRHTIPMRGVEKVNKLGFRKILNDDLVASRLLVLNESNDKWIDEVEHLIWNEKGTDCEAGQPDHCFVAGTMVETDHGEVPIEQIKVGDMVLTREGFHPVAICGKTGEKEVITRHFSNGRSLTGTPGHRMPTIDGDRTLLNLNGRDTLATNTVSNLSVVGPVIRETQTQSVYNLSVDGPHEYLANHIVVLNCSDATLYGWREAKHWQHEAEEKPKTTEQKIDETWQKMKKKIEAKQQARPLRIARI